MEPQQKRLASLLGHSPKLLPLAQLPDEICACLCDHAISLSMGGFDAIAAKVKLEKLITMTPDQILAAFTEFTTQKNNTQQ